MVDVALNAADVVASGGHAYDWSQLPNLGRALRNRNPVTGSAIVAVGVGSSIGNYAGPVGGNPAVSAPIVRFKDAFDANQNRVGYQSTTIQNKSQNGDILVSVNNNFAAWVTAYNPTVVLAVFGMNEFDSYGFNSLGLDLHRTAFRNFIRNCRKIGADPIICTSPHPHTGRITWPLASNQVQNYPVTYAAPVDAETQLWPPVSASVISAYPWKATTIPVAKRYLIGNEMIRQVCAEMGVLCLDVERYGFDATATYGEAGLFPTGEYKHGNALWYQETYDKAFFDLFTSLGARRHSTARPVERVSGRLLLNIEYPSADGVGVSDAPANYAIVQRPRDTSDNLFIDQNFQGTASYGRADGGGNYDYSAATSFLLPNSTDFLLPNGAAGGFPAKAKHIEDVKYNRGTGSPLVLTVADKSMGLLQVEMTHTAIGQVMRTYQVMFAGVAAGTVTPQVRLKMISEDYITISGDTSSGTAAATTFMSVTASGLDITMATSISSGVTMRYRFIG